MHAQRYTAQRETTEVLFPAASYLDLMTTFPRSSPSKQRQSLRIATDLPLHSYYSYDSPSDASSPDQTPTPTGTTPSTGTLDHALHVLCMYDFDSPDPDQLSFSRNEVLSIIKKEDSGWWAAMRPQEDRIGWIPSSFVEPFTSNELEVPPTPQDHGGPVEYPNQISWAYGGRPEFDDSPRTAIHESWVRVSEDHKTPSLQFVTPTDLVPHNDFLDDANGKHTHASFADLSNDERLSSLAVDLRFQPTTPRSLVSLSARALNFHSSPRSPLPLKEVQRYAHPSNLAQPEGASLRRPSRPRAVVMDDQASLLRLTELLDSDSAPIDSFVEPYTESCGASQSTPSLPEYSYRDKIDIQAQCQGLPASPRPTRANSTGSHVKSLSQRLYSNLAIWSPEKVAQYLCVLMHSLYTGIRQHECTMWVKEGRSPENSGLRHFLDTHDRIAWWVQKSILVHDDLSKRTDALGLWIRVAEKSLDLRNHDSLGAIALALSAVPVSSLGATWSQCTQQQSFIKLSEAVDISNDFASLVKIMDSADGPSVPFVRACLGYIKSLDVEHFGDQAGRSDYNANAVLIARRRKLSGGVANVLRHQSVPYDFEVGRSTRRYVDDQLQDASWVTSDWLLTRSQDIQRAEFGGSQN